MSQSGPPLTLDNIKAAIVQLYESNAHVTPHIPGHPQSLAPSAGQVAAKEIHDWLFAAQKRDEAWSLAGALLAENNTNMQFFGAHTYQVKITRDFATLEPEGRSALRAELLRWLVHFSAGPKVVLRKLCAATSALALRMVPNEWLHFIDSLWNHLNITTDLASTPQTHLHALLELLTILPEEVTRADIPQDQKSKVSAELCDGFPRILELLELCMGSHASSTKLVALQCLQSWIAFEIPVPMLPPIIAKTLELLASGDAEVFEPAIEVLHELVTHPKSGQYEASICDGVLVEVTTGSVRRYFDANFEDESTVRAVCRLLVAFGETFTAYVIRNFLRTDIMALLEMLLRCTAYPGYFAMDEEISDLTLNFWYLLQDTLLDDYYMPSDVAVDDTADEIEMLGSGSLDSANMVPAAEAKAAHEAVRKASIQVFLHLSRILCEKSAFPADDEWTRWPLDVQKKFRSYRRECGDTLVYCHYIVRDDLLAQLAQSLAKVTADLQLATVQWQPVEALQFAVRSIAEVVANDESMFMPAIFETMFTRLPRTVPRIAQTCIAVVGMHVGLRRVFLGGILFPETGAYAAWMNVHDSRYLFQSLELLTPFLTQPPSAAEGNTLAGEIARSAFRALRDVADVCRSHLVTSVDSFINLFLNVDGITAANRVELAESVGRIIQAMELSRQSAPLQMIIENIAGKMNHALTVMHQQDVTLAREAIMTCLQLINAVLRGIQLIEEDPDTGQPVVVSAENRAIHLRNIRGVLGAVWANLLAVAQLWTTDERVCQLLDSLLDATIPAFKGSLQKAIAGEDFVEPSFLITEWTLQYCRMFAQLALESFKRSPQLCWNSMITSLITVFGPVATYSNHTEAVFQQRYPRYTAEHLTTAQQLSEILVSAVTSMTLLASGALFGVEQPPSVFRSETQTNQGALHAMAAQMDTRPDLSEALFSMLNMCATRYPAALFAPPVFPTSSGTSPKLPDGFVHHVMALALAGLIMQERMSYKSDVQMLINLTALGKESSAVPNAVKVAVDGTMTSLGFHFVRELVNGLAASVPRTYLHLVADLLHKLVHRYPDGVRQWLKLSLGLPSMPGEQPLSDLVVTAAMRVSVTDREAFLRQMFSTRQIRPFKEATNEFALKCRGLHGTQYGQAT